MEKINNLHEYDTCNQCGETSFNHKCYTKEDLKQFTIKTIKEINQGNYNDLSWNDNQDVHISEAFVLSNWLKFAFDIKEEDLK